jgi:OOP family OmpA-OmpF porin
MKVFFAILALLSNFVLLSQQSSYNKVSIEANIGFTKPVYPFTEGYFTNFLSPSHTNLGFRYALNERFGIRADFGFDHFKNDKFGKNDTSIVFKSNYYRTSLEGVINLGNIIFKQKPMNGKFGLLLHGGGGFSILQSPLTLKGIEWREDQSDIMINVMMGTTGQYKVNERLALNLDLTMISHLLQTFTFDMYNSAKRGGFDGVLLNVNMGVSFYLGKKPQHIDWK